MPKRPPSRYTKVSKLLPYYNIVFKFFDIGRELYES